MHLLTWRRDCGVYSNCCYFWGSRSLQPLSASSTATLSLAQTAGLALASFQEARTKCMCYLKPQQAQQRSASKDGITGSAHSSRETQKYCLNCWRKWQLPFKDFFFLLPSNQSEENLWKMKCFIMLSEITWSQNHRNDQSSHLIYG